MLYNLSYHPHIQVETHDGIVALITDNTTGKSRAIDTTPAYRSWLSLGHKLTETQIDAYMTLVSDRPHTASEYTKAMHLARQTPFQRVWCEETSSYLLFSNSFGYPVMLEAITEYVGWRVIYLPSHEFQGTIPSTFNNREMVAALCSIGSSLAYAGEMGVRMEGYRAQEKRLDFLEAYRPRIHPQTIEWEFPDGMAVDAKAEQTLWWKLATDVMALERDKQRVTPQAIEFWRSLASRRAKQVPRTLVNVGVHPYDISMMYHITTKDHTWMFEIYPNLKPNGLPLSYTIFVDNMSIAPFSGRLDVVETKDQIVYAIDAFIERYKNWK